MTKTALEKIADRESVLGNAADQVRAQMDTLTRRLCEIDAELADLAVARRVILALGDDEPAHPRLPDNPVYQQILTVLNDTADPLRARDLCHALDLGLEPARIEGMRSKLKRLVAVGLVAEDEPGLFALPRPRTGTRDRDQPP
jgi:hypothetical protein